MNKKEPIVNRLCISQSQMTNHNRIFFPNLLYFANYVMHFQTKKDFVGCEKESMMVETVNNSIVILIDVSRLANPPQNISSLDSKLSQVLSVKTYIIISPRRCLQQIYT